MNWVSIIERLGLPVAFSLFVLFVFWRIVKWGLPRIDKMIDAHVERQRSMSESTAKLVEKTIEIQQATSQSVNDIKKDVPTTCKWKP